MVHYASRVVVNTAGGVAAAATEPLAATTAAEEVMHEGACAAADAAGTVCRESATWEALGELGGESMEANRKLLAAAASYAREWAEMVPFSNAILCLVFGMLIGVLIHRMRG